MFVDAVLLRGSHGSYDNGMADYAKERLDVSIVTVFSNLLRYKCSGFDESSYLFHSRLQEAYFSKLVIHCFTKITTFLAQVVDNNVLIRSISWTMLAKNIAKIYGSMVDNL